MVYADIEGYEDEALSATDARDYSVQSLLEYLSLEVIGLNITQQLDGSLESSRDFLTPALQRYEFFRANKTEASDIKELDDEIISFCAKIIGAISDRYHIHIDPVTDDSLDYLEIADTLYTFFILYREEYVTNYLIHYILKDGMKIVEAMDLGQNATDLSTQAYKKLGVDKDTVTIIANINGIIDYIVTEDDFPPEEFLSVVGTGDNCVEVLADYYQTYVVCGSFGREYLDIVADRTTEQSLRIRNNIRALMIARAISMAETSKTTYQF